MSVILQEKIKQNKQIKEQEDRLAIKWRCFPLDTEISSFWVTTILLEKDGG